MNEKVIVTSLSMNDILNAVENLRIYLSDEYNRKSQIRKIYGEKVRETKRDKDYLLIYEMLKKQHKGVSPISKTSIWRYIKIIEIKDSTNSKSELANNLYNQIKSGEIGIKKAYNILFNKEENINEKVEVKTENDKTNKMLTLQDIIDLQNEINNQLMQFDLSTNGFSSKSLKELDDLLFKSRKSLSKLITKQMYDET